MNNSEQNTTGASRLKYAMAIKGISQHELAKMAHISDASMSQYASGLYKPKQDRIMIFAQLLNVSEDWLMGYDVPMEKIHLDRETIELIKAFNELSYEKKATIKQLIDQMK